MDFPCQAKVGDLDGVCGWGGGRGDQARVSCEGVIIGGGCGDEDVLGFDVAMEELTGMDMVEARENLVEDALYVFSIQGLVVTRFHELVQVAIHVLHADVQFLGQWVEEDVEGWDDVRMRGKRSEEDDLAEFQARRERREGLLHGFDGDL